MCITLRRRIGRETTILPRFCAKGWGFHRKRLVVIKNLGGSGSQEWDGPRTDALRIIDEQALDRGLRSESAVYCFNRRWLCSEKINPRPVSVVPGADSC